MKRLEIFGATPSPYTQKMLTLLRYKRIPYNIHWGDTRGRLESLNLELPKPVLLPVILFENEEKELVATTDSTPMIRRLENEHPCLLYTSPSPRDKRQSRMPSSA